MCTICICIHHVYDITICMMTYIMCMYMVSCDMTLCIYVYTMWCISIPGYGGIWYSTLVYCIHICVHHVYAVTYIMCMVWYHYM